ncbi:MAG: hypothetical protein H3C58_15250 [Fimbriimonadaceae bacterium]|nr:hypothetical protein [Fimbriimonadaceae bacterium]
MSTQDDDREGCQAQAGSVIGCRLPVDPALREQGWEWRCNADGAKLHQVVNSYRELGFEVRMERLNLRSLSENCAGCKGALAQASAVFIKQKT